MAEDQAQTEGPSRKAMLLHRMKQLGAGLGAAGLAGGAMLALMPGMRRNIWYEGKRLLGMVPHDPGAGMASPEHAKQTAKEIIHAIERAGIPREHARIAVSGIGGSGKSTVARALAERMGTKAHELDSVGKTFLHGRRLEEHMAATPVLSGSVFEQTHLLNKVDPRHFNVAIRVKTPVERTRKQLLQRQRGAWQHDLYDIDKLDRTVHAAHQHLGGQKLQDVGNIEIRVAPLGQTFSSSPLREALSRKGISPTGLNREEQLQSLLAGRTTAGAPALQYFKKPPLAALAGVPLAAGAINAGMVPAPRGKKMKTADAHDSIQPGAALTGAAALGLAAHAPLARARKDAVRRANRQMWLRSLKGGAAGAVAAPLVLGSGRMPVMDDLTGPQIKGIDLAQHVQPGDVLLTGRANNHLHGSKLDKAIALLSGTPNTYHTAVVHHVNPDGGVHVVDHGPGGTTDRGGRWWDHNKHTATILRPKQEGAAAGLLHGMDRRSRLIGEVYSGLKDTHKVHPDAVQGALSSFYSKQAPVGPMGHAVGVPRLNPYANQQGHAQVEKHLKDLEDNMPRHLEEAAESIKRTGKLPANSPIRTLDAICTSAAAEAGAPLQRHVNPAVALAADYHRAAAAGMYERVGYWLPEGAERAGKGFSFASRWAAPALQATAGFGAGTLAHRAALGSAEKKLPFLLKNPKATAAAIAATAAGAGMLSWRRGEEHRPRHA